MRLPRIDRDVAMTLAAILIVFAVYADMAPRVRAAWADQAVPELAPVHVAAPAAQPLPPKPAPVTIRTVTGDHGDRITYCPAPGRPADLTMRLTAYQPCSPDNRPWHDACTGGGACDCRGYPLHWGCLATGPGWAYGTRIYLGAPLWQVFATTDRFGGWQPHNRADLCCWAASQFDYWDSMCDRPGGLVVQAWVLKKGE